MTDGVFNMEGNFTSVSDHILIAEHGAPGLTTEINFPANPDQSSPVICFETC